MTHSPNEQARFNMIEQQVRPWNVLDAAVLALMSVVKREEFVPAAYKSIAFADLEVPLGHGQCMLAPRLEARLLQDLAVQKTDKVLEVGTGSGFMAALLGHQAQRVLSLELEPDSAVGRKRRRSKGTLVVRALTPEEEEVDKKNDNQHQEQQDHQE